MSTKAGSSQDSHGITFSFLLLYSLQLYIIFYDKQINDKQINPQCFAFLRLFFTVVEKRCGSIKISLSQSISSLVLEDH